MRQSVATAQTAYREAAQIFGTQSAQAQTLRERLQNLNTAYGNVTSNIGLVRNAQQGLANQAAQLNSALAAQSIQQQTQALIQNHAAQSNSASAAAANTNSISNQAVQAANATAANNTLANSVQNLGRMMQAVILGAAGKTLYSALIGSNAEYEQTMIRFKVLLGSVDEAKNMLDNIKNSSMSNFIDISAIQKAATTMSSFNVETKDIMPVLEAIGDISGGSAERMQSLSLAFSQMTSLGRLMAQDLNQMVNAGFNPLQQMSVTTGKSIKELREDMANGAISAKDITKAFIDAASEGGKFYGMMSEQSKTLAGSISILKTTFKNFLRDVGAEAFSELRGSMGGLVEEIEKLKDNGELAANAKEIGRTAANLTKFIIQLTKFIHENRDALTALIVGLAGYKAGVTPVELLTLACAKLTATLKALGVAMVTTRTSIMAIAGAFAVVTAAATAFYLVIDNALDKGYKALAEAEKADIKANIAQLEAKKAGYLGVADGAIKNAEAIAILQKEIDNYRKQLGTFVPEQKNTADVLADTANAAEDLAQRQKALSETLKNAASDVSELNQTLYDLSQGESLNSSEVYNLIEKYPKLASAVSKTSDGYKIEKSALEDLRKIRIDEARAALQAEADKTRAVLEQSKSRLKAYGIEIDSIKNLEDSRNAKNKVNIGSIADFNFDSKAYDAAYKEAEKRRSELEEYGAALDKVSQSIELLNDISFGVNHSDALKSAEDAKNKAEKDEEERRKKAEKAAQEARDKEFSDLKYSLDLEYIADVEYYAKLEELRNKHFEKGSSEWQKYTFELKKFWDEYAENAEDKQREAFDKLIDSSELDISEHNFYDDWTVPRDEIDAWNAVKEQLKQGYEDSIIDKEEYENKLREIDRNIFKAEKDITDALEKEQEKRNATFKKLAKERYDDIIKIRQKELDANIKSLQSELKARKDAADAQIKAVQAQADALKKSDDDYYKNRDKAKLQERAEVFKSAVTVEGRNEYERIQAELEQFERDERRAQIEEATNKSVEQIEAAQESYAEWNKEHQESLKESFDEYKEQEKQRLDALKDAIDDENAAQKEVGAAFDEFKAGLFKDYAEETKQKSEELEKAMNDFKIKETEQLSTANNTLRTELNTMNDVLDSVRDISTIGRDISALVGSVLSSLGGISNTINQTVNNTNNLTMYNEVANNQAAETMIRSMQLSMGGASVYA
ncbi:hypothetical protein FACS1894188_02110 [Clostridia bacterium]|nr:hypothetical protein FACS1894188_02110 [Clostridia bacterium]